MPYQGTYMAQNGNCINAVGAIAGFTIDAVYDEHGYVRYPNGAITTFDAPGAGTTPYTYQGTWPNAINLGGTIVGYITDTNTTNHGFVRYPNGHFTTFDAPGAVATPGTYQGTDLYGVNLWGAIVGSYTDAKDVSHGFLLNPDGTFTKIDVPGAGTSPLQGTIPLSINLEGAITGVYFDANGAGHGFVVNP